MAESCLDCGLSAALTDSRYIKCYIFKRDVDVTIPRNWGCLYFCKRIIESGDLLTPFEHYLIRNDEIERAK